MKSAIPLSQTLQSEEFGVLPPLEKVSYIDGAFSDAAGLARSDQENESLFAKQYELRHNFLREAVGEAIFNSTPEALRTPENIQSIATLLEQKFSATDGFRIDDGSVIDFSLNPLGPGDSPWAADASRGGELPRFLAPSERQKLLKQAGATETQLPTENGYVVPKEDADAYSLQRHRGFLEQFKPAIEIMQKQRDSMIDEHRSKNWTPISDEVGALFEYRRKPTVASDHVYQVKMMTTNRDGKKEEKLVDFNFDSRPDERQLTDAIAGKVRENRDFYSEEAWTDTTIQRSDRNRIDGIIGAQSGFDETVNSVKRSVFGSGGLGGIASGIGHLLMDEDDVKRMRENKSGTGILSSIFGGPDSAGIIDRFGDAIVRATEEEERSLPRSEADMKSVGGTPLDYMMGVGEGSGPRKYTDMMAKMEKLGSVATHIGLIAATGSLGGSAAAGDVAAMAPSVTAQSFTKAALARSAVNSTARFVAGDPLRAYIAMTSAGNAATGANEIYHSLREKGLSDKEASAYATEFGVVEGSIAFGINMMAGKAITENSFASESIRNWLTNSMSKAVASAGLKGAAARGITNTFAALPGDLAVGIGAGLTTRTASSFLKGLASGENEFAEARNTLESEFPGIIEGALTDDALFGAMGAGVFGNLHPRGVSSPDPVYGVTGNDEFVQSMRYKILDGAGGKKVIQMPEGWMARFKSADEANSFRDTIIDLETLRSEIFNVSENGLMSVKEGVSRDAEAEFWKVSDSINESLAWNKANSQSEVSEYGISSHQNLKDAVNHARDLASKHIAELGGKSIEQRKSELADDLMGQWVDGATNWAGERARMVNDLMAERSRPSSGKSEAQRNADELFKKLNSMDKKDPAYEQIRIEWANQSELASKPDTVAKGRDQASAEKLADEWIAKRREAEKEKFRAKAEQHAEDLITPYSEAADGEPILPAQIDKIVAERFAIDKHNITYDDGSIRTVFEVRAKANRPSEKSKITSEQFTDNSYQQSPRTGEGYDAGMLFKGNGLATSVVDSLTDGSPVLKTDLKYLSDLVDHRLSNLDLKSEWNKANAKPTLDGLKKAIEARMKEIESSQAAPAKPPAAQQAPALSQSNQAPIAPSKQAQTPIAATPPVQQAPQATPVKRVDTAPLNQNEQAVAVRQIFAKDDKLTGIVDDLTNGVVLTDANKSYAIKKIDQLIGDAGPLPKRERDFIVPFLKNIKRELRGSNLRLPGAPAPKADAPARVSKTESAKIDEAVKPKSEPVAPSKAKGKPVSAKDSFNREQPGNASTKPLKQSIVEELQVDGHTPEQAEAIVETNLEDPVRIIAEVKAELHPKASQLTDERPLSQKLLDDLPDAARSKWTPEELAKVDEYSKDGKESALDGLTRVKKGAAIRVADENGIKNIIPDENGMVKTVVDGEPAYKIVEPVKDQPEPTKPDAPAVDPVKFKLAEKLADTVDDIILNDGSVSSVVKAAKKAFEAGIIEESRFLEAQRVAKDRDMNSQDVAEEFLSEIQEFITSNTPPPKPKASRRKGQEGSTILFSELADFAIGAVKKGWSAGKYAVEAVAKFGNGFINAIKSIWGGVAGRVATPYEPTPAPSAARAASEAPKRSSGSSLRENPLLKQYLEAKKTPMSTAQERLVSGIRDQEEHLIRKGALNPKKRIGNSYDKVMSTAISEVRRIHPSLEKIFQHYEFNHTIRMDAYAKSTEGAFKAFKKMSKKDGEAFIAAYRQGDASIMNPLVSKYKLQGHLQGLKDFFEAIHSEATAAGIKMGKIKDYFPTTVKAGKHDEFMAVLRDSPLWGKIDEAIRKAETSGSEVRILSASEKADIASSVLKQNFSARGKAANSRERKVRDFKDEYSEFYDSPAESLQNYIARMANDITNAEFFGVDAETRSKIARDGGAEFSIEGSHVGEAVYSLMKKGEINGVQQSEIQRIIQDRLGFKGDPKLLRLAKQGNIWFAMNSPIRAIGQLQELALVAYQQGLFNTASSLIGVTAGKQKTISLQDLGIQSGMQVTGHREMLSRGSDLIWRYSGYKFFDGLAAKTNNAAYLKRLKSMSDRQLTDHLADYQSIWSRPVSEVAAEIKAGKVSSLEAKEVFFNNLAQIRPVSLMGMPRAFLKGSWGTRLLYNLKTFQIHQLDFIRNETLGKMKSDPVGSLKSLVSLGFMLTMAGAGIDQTKDFILGRKTSLEDSVHDNMLKLVFLSRYQMDSLSNGGSIKKSVLNAFNLPMVDFMSNLWDAKLKTDKNAAMIEPWYKDLSKSKLMDQLPTFGIGQYNYWRYSDAAPDKQLNFIKKDYPESVTNYYDRWSVLRQMKEKRRTELGINQEYQDLSNFQKVKAYYEKRIKKSVAEGDMTSAVAWGERVHWLAKNPNEWVVEAQNVPKDNE